MFLFSCTVDGIGLSMTSGLGESLRMLKVLLPLPSGFQCNCWINHNLILSLLLGTASSPEGRDFSFLSVLWNFIMMCFNLLCRVFSLFSLRTLFPCMGKLSWTITIVISSSLFSVYPFSGAHYLDVGCPGLIFLLFFFSFHHFVFFIYFWGTLVNSVFQPNKDCLPKSVNIFILPWYFNFQEL